MASVNPFDLLGDDDNDDPSQLIAKKALAPTSAPPQQQPKPQAKLPSKPLPPAQAEEMAENQLLNQPQPLDQHEPSPPLKEDMISCVMALDAALLPCLPARELQAIDRSPHPSHQIDVERHAREFMEAAKKLQLYFLSLQQEDNPSKAETLRKEISMMEEELKTKNELINKHEKLIQNWRTELKEQLNKHITELERV